MKPLSPFPRIGFALTLLVLACLPFLSACSSSEKEDPAASGEAPEQQTMWLGHALVHRDGAAVVDSVVKPLDVISLQQGDVIKTIGAASVSTPEEVVEQFNQVKAGEEFLLVIQRGELTRAAMITRPDSLQAPGAEPADTSTAGAESTE